MKKTLPQFLAVTLLAIFIIFTILVRFEVFKGVDLAVTTELQKNLPKDLTFVFSAFSLLGSLEIVISILLLALYLYKKLNYFYVLLFFAILHVLEFIGKVFVNHPGPLSKFFLYTLCCLSFACLYKQIAVACQTSNKYKFVYAGLFTGTIFNK